MNNPKIDWYGRDELRSLKETAQPENVAEVLPTITPVAQEVPEYRDWETDRKSTRLNSSHSAKSRMPSSA